MAWSNIGGGDHAGADWIIGSSITVGGTHSNIGRFEVQSGQTATVQAGAAFEVQGRDILVLGTINADGAGYVGGVGGSGVYAGDCGAGSCPSSCTGSARAGNHGTDGDGPYGGIKGAPGGNGGYMAVASNGDYSISESVTMGSGGGGGKAGNSCTPNCNADCPTKCGCAPNPTDNHCRGGRGGPYDSTHLCAGGGAVVLSASNYLSVSGTVSAKGVGTVAGGNGESDSCGYGNPGYASGRGAGGGIFLKCSGTGGVDVSGTLDTRGGGNNTTIYGTTKIFALPGRISIGSATKYTGHAGSGGYGIPYTSETLAAPVFIF